jgi:uncharacterized membrane protein YfhO
VPFDFLSEPITTLTDYALAIESLIFATLLWQPSHPSKLWSLAFIGVAIATLCGGTYHGFQLPSTIEWSLWRTLTYALSLSSSCMLAATLYQFPRQVRAWGLGAIALKSALYLSWATSHPDFLYIIVDYISAMLILLAIHIRLAIHHKKHSTWIILGVLTSLFAAVVQGLGLSLTVHLNQNDLYHLVQMVALYCFYKGARLI